MTRAALLPFTGDPFLFKEWLGLFNSVWGNEIDHLYIMLNANIPANILEYNTSLIHNPVTQISLLVSPGMLDHGPALNRLLGICTEDLIMLIEEDAFIFKQDQVNKCFKLIEDGKTDIVASPRGSCSSEIYHRAETVWGTPSQAPNFWPNFFFISRKNLLKTDRHFHAKQWKKGDYIKELGVALTDEISPADTFVWASIQLRGMGLRVELVEQYHSRIEDIQDKDQIKGVFDRKCPWVHIGSLSGWQHILFDPLQPRIGEVEEWERRAGAWLLFWEDAQEGLNKSMQDFSNLYKSGIDRLIKEYTLSEARIKLRTNLFRELISPQLHAKKQAEANKL